MIDREVAQKESNDEVDKLLKELQGEQASEDSRIPKDKTDKDKISTDFHEYDDKETENDEDW